MALAIGFGRHREAQRLSAQDPNAVKAVRGPVQLALRVSSTSVTVITPGAGCSITSTATISTTGVTGRFTFRAAFFTGEGFGLALATVRVVALAALDALRALPRLAEFPLRSFARFCTFDAFLRLAMIAPPDACNDTTVQVAARYQTRVITRFQLERDRLGDGRVGRRGSLPHHFTSRFRQPARCRPRKRYG